MLEFFAEEGRGRTKGGREKGKGGGGERGEGSRPPPF